MSCEDTNPWDKSFQEARAVAYRTKAAVSDTEAALRATGDNLIRKELTRALATLRVADKRARLVFEDQSLRCAPQRALGAVFESEGASNA